MPAVEDQVSSFVPRHPLIRVEHLSKTYPSGMLRKGAAQRTAAIHDISFDIPPGETLGLVGHSGSGKTTIGRTMLRLIEPSSGSVFVNLPGADSVDLTSLGSEDLRLFRRHLQMVFQDPHTSLNPRMTVREAVEEPLRIHGIVEPSDIVDRVKQLLEQVGLSMSLAGELPGKLSGGQRQRVGIARAIATEPHFVVADEPVTALDVSVQAQILNLLNDLQNQLGLSYLFISHDMAAVQHVSDRIAVLAEGGLVEIGEAAEILANPYHPHTKSLVEAARAGRSTLGDVL